MYSLLTREGRPRLSIDHSVKNTLSCSETDSMYQCNLKLSQLFVMAEGNAENRVPFST